MRAQSATMLVQTAEIDQWQEQMEAQILRLLAQRQQAGNEPVAASTTSTIGGGVEPLPEFRWSPLQAQNGELGESTPVETLPENHPTSPTLH